MPKLSESFYAQQKCYEEMADVYLRYLREMEAEENRAADGAAESDSDGGVLFSWFKQELKELHKKGL